MNGSVFDQIEVVKQGGRVQGHESRVGEGKEG